jgi:hypothetical protein
MLHLPKSRQGLRSGQILILTLFSFTIIAEAGNKFQERDTLSKIDTISFTGQISTGAAVTSGSSLPLWGGLRYLPQLDAGIIRKRDNGREFNTDFEISLNLYGSGSFGRGDSLKGSAGLKPYRIWARFSTDRFEVRAGLQKINFGSASILRPLMWFDKTDARDPLRLTDGVWGVLCRYYFQNNANIWIWALYGNNVTKGWESVATRKETPEFGGRIQYPVHGGEAAFTFHHRRSELSSENRYGFDIKADLGIGVWLEGTAINSCSVTGLMRNQTMLNIGADYTFGIGNGLGITLEQLFAGYGEKSFGFNQALSLSALSMDYPVGINDRAGLILYYDNTHGNFYNFFSWQRILGNFTLYLTGWLNPKTNSLPLQAGGENLYAGAGGQILFVYNY